MNFRKILDKFIWKPEKEYSFFLPDNDNEQSDTYIPEKNLSYPKNVFPRLSENFDYIKVRFNTLINNDIVTRKFAIVANREKI